MSERFNSFVVFAEMRTGSNFLEANLNAFPGLNCHGEAFNPHFIGYPNRDDILGVTLAEREANPERLLNVMRSQPDVMGGFRFFHDHDPRVLELCLNDRRCAKIILTRNPVDSYVSWKIAQATGQWKLTDVRRRKDSKVRFDQAEFKEHVEKLRNFQLSLMHALQTSAQTAFYVAYEDLQDVAVMNGLAQFLGQSDRLDKLDGSLKPQNPSAISEKVSNFEDVSDALAELDRFNLSRTPNFEPRRGAAVPSYAAAAVAPLLYLPMRSGPEEQVLNWLAGLDNVDPDGLIRSFNQKSLRQWKRAHTGHRSFTVVRHPVARAHAAFCRYILSTGTGSFIQIRNTLRKVYKVPLPKNVQDEGYDVQAHRQAFLGYLDFVKANLAGQTSIRVDAHWATQASILQGFRGLALPDMVVREDEMNMYLPALAMQVGWLDAAEPAAAPDDIPFPLSAVYDDKIEALVAQIYHRDYMQFGFGAWK